MLEEIKLALRITNDKFDSELQDLKSAAIEDLKLSGVNKLADNDSLIKRAVIVYCKANFGLDNSDSEKYQKCYDLLKNHLSLSSDYGSVNNDME